MVVRGEEEPDAGVTSTWVASSPNSQDPEEAVDGVRLCPPCDDFEECLVKDLVQAWMAPARVLPLLVVLDSLPLRGMVELLNLEKGGGMRLKDRVDGWRMSYGR